MLSTVQHPFGEFLRHTASALDISPELRRKAIAEYEAVGQWLGADDSPLRPYLPRIYPQGSFRLGTVIRPLTDEDHCDIDLVCWLQIRKEHITQRELKAMVGDRLKAHSTYRRFIEECRTCWTLKFDNEFRMDVLPCIPDATRLPDGILITDKELVRWLPSNPMAFAEWFKERMRVERERLLILANKANVENVPDWDIKTPLQRVVQLCKRHRDLRCEFEDEDLKPLSIIITTLVAKAYDNEADLLDAMEKIVRTMRDHIEVRDGDYWVENPVNCVENFAAGWNEDPRKRKVFYDWMDTLDADFDAALAERGLHKVKMVLANSFGRGPVERAYHVLGADILTARVGGRLSVTPTTGLLTTGAGIPVASHRFFGDAHE